MSYKITIIETADDPTSLKRLREESSTNNMPPMLFRYEQIVADLDVKAIYDLVNKKQRAKRSDSGVQRVVHLLKKNENIES